MKGNASKDASRHSECAAERLRLHFLLRRVALSGTGQELRQQERRPARAGNRKTGWVLIPTSEPNRDCPARYRATMTLALAVRPSPSVRRRK